MIPGSGAASTLMDCHVQSGYACLNRRNYVIESRRDDSKNDCSERMTRRLKILRRLVIRSIMATNSDHRSENDCPA